MNSVLHKMFEDVFRQKPLKTATLDNGAEIAFFPKRYMSIGAGKLLYLWGGDDHAGSLWVIPLNNAAVVFWHFDVETEKLQCHQPLDDSEPPPLEDVASRKRKPPSDERSAPRDFSELSMEASVMLPLVVNTFKAAIEEKRHL